MDDELENLFREHGYRKIKKIIQEEEYINLPANEIVKKSNSEKPHSNNKKRDYVILPKKNDQGRAYDLDELSIYLKQNHKTHEVILDSNINIDYKLYKKFQYGELNVYERIDLHGYKIDEAYILLIKFIKESFLKEKRFILIVTGLSNFSDDSIRNNVLKWINGSHDLQRIILYLGFANKKHGGEGAFYCYLRKNNSLLKFSDSKSNRCRE